MNTDSLNVMNPQRGVKALFGEVCMNFSLIPVISCANPFLKGEKK